jgi:ribonuclease HII
MAEEIHLEFPDYFFNENKGYGTKKHYQAIEKYGICKYHRKSFLKRFFEEEKLF